MLSARLIKKLEGIEKCSKNGHEVRNLFHATTYFMQGNYHPGDDQ
jgi:hypothetical protein